MKTKPIILASVCLLCDAICGLRAFANTTRYVSLDGTNDVLGGYANWPGAATTIQAAIVASDHGDVIIVSNGTFKAAGTEVVNINKSVDIRSLAGRDLTIIDGEESRRCVQMASNAEEYPIYLTGFTIRNGQASSGAGINADSLCEMIVSDCSIISNYTADKGGGVRKATAYTILTLTNCLIANNTADVYGGGIYTLTGRVRVYDCDIISNKSAGAAGIYGGASTSTGIIIEVFSSLIQYNEATNDNGGGVGLHLQGNSISMLDGCTIANNRTANRGGGIYTRDWTGTNIISYCVFNNNESSSFGGGLYLSASDIVNSCLLSCNTGSIGGGLYVRSYPVELINLTIVSNYGVTASGGGGGGFASYSEANCSLLNCIIYGNSSAAAYVVRSNLHIAAGVTFTNCCTAPLTGNGTTVQGSGNINFDPQYVYSEDGHFHLAPESPCVNYGITQPWMCNARDIVGHSRVDRFSGKVDLGAYEYIPPGMLFNIK